MKNTWASCLVGLLVWVCTTTVADGQSCTTSTPDDLLGPFYLANSPQTTELAPAAELMDPQTRLEVSGTIFTSTVDRCEGLANAIVEVWYAGFPTNDGYRNDQYRGQMVTNALGQYRFVQKFPALYPSRPIIHDHFRITNPQGQLLLVTQMYFYGTATGYVNPSDTTRLLQTVSIQSTAAGRSVVFDIFVDNSDSTNDSPTCVGLIGLILCLLRSLCFLFPGGVCAT